MSLDGIDYVSPLGSTYDDWASDLCDQLSSYNVPNPGPEDLWRDWAVAVISLPDIAELGAPDPRGFEDWREWASFLLAVLA